MCKEYKIKYNIKKIINVESNHLLIKRLDIKSPIENSDLKLFC